MKEIVNTAKVTLVRSICCSQALPRWQLLVLVFSTKRIPRVEATLSSSWRNQKSSLENKVPSSQTRHPPHTARHFTLSLGAHVIAR